MSACLSLTRAHAYARTYLHDGLDVLALGELVLEHLVDVHDLHQALGEIVLVRALAAVADDARPDTNRRHQHVRDQHVLRSTRERVHVQQLAVLGRDGAEEIPHSQRIEVLLRAANVRLQLVVELERVLERR